MKNVTLVLVVVLLLTGVNPVHAQDPRTVGVFGSAWGSCYITAVAFIPFNLYVVGFRLDGQVKGWELSVGFADPAPVILSRTLDQAGSINVGNFDNFIVGSGGCFDGSGAYVFVTYNAGYFVPAPPLDVPVCPMPADPSSFSPAVPGYLQCDGSLVPLHPFPDGHGIYPDGCGIINPTNPCDLATEPSSFGAVKSQF